MIIDDFAPIKSLPLKLQKVFLMLGKLADHFRYSENVIGKIVSVAVIIVSLAQFTVTFTVNCAAQFAKFCPQSLCILNVF